MARSKTDAKNAHATRMRKIARATAIRKRYKKIEYNINNQMETMDDLKFLRNSFSAKSEKHGDFWGRHFNLRKHLAMSLSANKMQQNLDASLSEEHDEIALLSSINPYGSFMIQSNQSDPQQNESTNGDSILDLIQNYIDLNQLNQSEPKQMERFQEQIQNSSDIDNDLQNLFSSIANPITPLD